ncbi:MAG: hypothetical protein KC484_04015 [Colwelliaceae bacterium]|nr:hypothetical protein [Colwelliaceae bacterium]
MKIGKSIRRFCLLYLLFLSPVTVAQDNEAVLNPGTISGSVSLNGYTINKVTVKAIDTNKVFSSAVTVNVLEGANSIDYELTLEGDNEYYLMAEAYLVSEDFIKVLIPPSAPVFVSVDGAEVRDISMTPVEITGTISTGDDFTLSLAYRIGAWLNVPEFEDEPWPHQSETVVSEQNINGLIGIPYKILVAPENQYYNVRAQVSLNGFNYNINDTDVITPSVGQEILRDYLLNYDSASISGNSQLSGVELISSEVFGQAPAPLPRGTRTSTANTIENVFNLPVDQGVWNLTSIFNFYLPSAELSNLTGLVYAGWPESFDVQQDELIVSDFVIEPSLMPGKLTLVGANTQFSQGRIRANGSPGGLSHSDISSDTGRFIYVLPPGKWQRDNRLTLWFNYEQEVDNSLNSLIWQEYRSPDGQIDVLGGENFDEFEVEYNTSTIEYLFSVANEEELSHPYLKVTRLHSINSIAQGYGSADKTTLGKAKVTLLEPGDYLIEAFARVNDSEVEFGSTEVTVEGGESIVIGGNSSPLIRLLDVIDGTVTCDDFVEINGTATDSQGIDSIMINGISIPFTLTNNSNDLNEVSFSYNVELESDTENTIQIVANGVKQSGGTTIDIRVTQQNCQSDNQLVFIDIKPGTCKNPVNVKSKGVLPVTIFGSEDFDVSTVSLDSIFLQGVSPTKSAIKDLGQPLSEVNDKCQNEVSDGYDDLTLKFRTQHLINALKALGLGLGDGDQVTLSLSGVVEVSGELKPFQGQNNISIISK